MELHEICGSVCSAVQQWVRGCPCRRMRPTGAQAFPARAEGSHKGEFIGAANRKHCGKIQAAPPPPPTPAPLPCGTGGRISTCATTSRGPTAKSGMGFIPLIITGQSCWHPLGASRGDRRAPLERCPLAQGNTAAAPAAAILPIPMAGGADQQPKKVVNAEHPRLCNTPKGRKTSG